MHMPLKRKNKMGKLLIYLGIIMLIIGLVIEYVPISINWFGRLPGDIRINKPGFSFFMPITSMILFSVAVSLLIWLYKQFFS